MSGKSPIRSLWPHGQANKHKRSFLSQKPRGSANFPQLSLSHHPKTLPVTLAATGFHQNTPPNLFKRRDWGVRRAPAEKLQLVCQSSQPTLCLCPQPYYTPCILGRAPGLSKATTNLGFPFSTFDAGNLEAVQMSTNSHPAPPATAPAILAAVACKSSSPVPLQQGRTPSSN